MPGIALNRSDIDHIVGQAALDLNVAFDRVTALRAALQKRGKPALLVAGYEDTEADFILAALDDLAQLGQIYRGAANGTLQNPKDFRDKISELWGVGVR